MFHPDIAASLIEERRAEFLAGDERYRLGREIKRARALVSDVLHPWVMSQPQMRVSMPDQQVPGVYADFVSVWHTGDVFTFDFAALARPPTTVEGDDGRPVTTAQAQIVARVRVPPSQVFEIMKALERQLTAWEHETARRAKPAAPPEQS